MNPTELRSEVASYRLMLRNKTPKLVTSGPHGPIDMDLIDTPRCSHSSLEMRLDALERPKR